MDRNPLLGQAIGDRIGGPIRMALMLGESLISRSGLDTQHIAAQYLDWYNTDAFDTGPIWHQVFDRVNAGSTPEEAARSVHESSGGMTAGTNPSHRATALGCASVIPDAELADMARLEARLTHWHPEAGEAAAATAVIIRSQLRGASLAEAVRSAAYITSGEVTERLKNPSAPQRSGYAPLTLEAAIYFTAHASSFEDAMRSALLFAGPPNYCPVLVGAFAAAEYGYTPLQGLDVQPEIRSNARRVFSELWNPPLRHLPERCS